MDVLHRQSSAPASSQRLARAGAALLLLSLVAGANAYAAAPACALGMESVRFALPDADRNFATGWHLRVSIAGGRSRSVQVDTGSIGFVVARNAIGPHAVGPLEPGRQEYTSDGLILEGHYFRAAVTFENGSAPATTVPITVLGVERLACDRMYPKCSLRGRNVRSVGVLGVGFARKETIGDNAFLALTAMASGAMHRGYIVTSTGITLGLTSSNTVGFRYVQLSQDGAGKWRGAPGCFGFPGKSGFEQICGTMLVDTGISSMIVSRAVALRPPGMAADIPAGTAMAVASPDFGGAGMSYQFTIGGASAAAPKSIRWSNASGTDAFVNTGRNVLRAYDYLYDAKCGRVGFRPV